MQEFLTNNTVNCNLMSLTGYRTLVILKALMESPKTNDEINNFLLNDQYIKENFSNDTLRLYINSLREAGCEIKGANKSNNRKYELISHPFDYDISKAQLNALDKLYKNIYDKIDIKDAIDLENFFEKLSKLIKNEKTKETLQNIPFLRHINKSFLKDLFLHCKNKNQITFLYNSPKSGKKAINLIVDKLSFKSGKLYLCGTNLTHKQYSYFALDRILKIQSTNLFKTEEYIPDIKVIYELYNNENYLPKTDEKIIAQKGNKLIIEVISKNEFCLMQRILYMGNDCKIIEPADFKNKLLKKLQIMEKIYE